MQRCSLATSVSPRGTCQRLIVGRGQGVQCYPQDGRISALRIEIDRSASAWQFTGRVVCQSEPGRGLRKESPPEQ